MPADRRSFSASKPLKTERTHEENQERAYIAASRRSDRSLEARIESARRASEIHKRRTGRALRVTEQDVANEEMYEEEDDDLPTQYQRLNAHLHTSSLVFNRKLHDYLATQHGVRSMYFSQLTQPFYASPHMQNAPHAMGAMQQPGQMAPPQSFNPSSPAFTQQTQPFSPQAFQQSQQSYRQSPYMIPQRPTSHQRSASIPTPHHMPNYGTSMPQPTDATATTPRDESRRMSLPPQNVQAGYPQSSDATSRPSPARSASHNALQQPSSPQQATSSASTTPPSANDTPRSPADNTSTSAFAFSPAISSQVIGMNPLSLSLPPESQQLLGSALDPNDPRTSIFMSGSDNLPQPFTGTYSYNPNLPAKSSHTAMAQTLSPDSNVKLDTDIDPTISTAPSSAMTDNMYSPNGLFTPTFDYDNMFDTTLSGDIKFSSNDQLSKEVFNDEAWVNWDE
ncbi:hypothetical protein BS50DRAFT_132385 [Corynespora cassiicola Philippines]|uniref:Uncharacterized protein n=1 Tax=Corynespora cassiicola Philippines TaxID=1448308 RepID=A0A2T2NBS0_CORCC|nr:hypothetical protein BS50DRAFT_132385 [Corynespora cassiicola Philippines]